jgi:hypothetical protein
MTGGVNQLPGPGFGVAHSSKRAQSKPKFRNGFHHYGSFPLENSR